MKFLNKIKRLSQVKINRIKALKAIKHLTLILLEFGTALLVGAFFGSKLFTYHALKITDFSSPTAITLFVLEIAACIISIATVFLSKKREGTGGFMLKTAAAFTFCMALWGFLGDLFLPSGRATADNIAKTIIYNNVTLGAGCGFLAVCAVFSIYINRQCISKNNWYLFFTIMPSVFMASTLYRRYLAVSEFYNEHNFNEENLMKFMQKSQKISGLAGADVGYLNEYVNMFIASGLIGLTILLMCWEGVLYSDFFEGKIIRKEEKENRQ